MRAQHVEGEAVQIVLGEAARGSPSGTAWIADGTRRQEVVRLGPGGRSAKGHKRAKPRLCSALVFGDVPGFSNLPDTYLPIFWDTVMSSIGDVVAANASGLALRNTWGDAIHFVVPDVRRAAEICLSVQRRLSALDGRLLGWDAPPTMRIGAHYGPIFEGWDPIAAQRTFYGRAISRAARIEPITPPGTVYVTEAFAAILLLESRGEFSCTYVGQVPLAKGFGTFRMYDLSREPAGDVNVSPAMASHDLKALKRRAQPMPGFVRDALQNRKLMDRYEARPPYQRNDYLGWINRAKLMETKQKRLAQMLDELKADDSYMGMAWRPKGQ
jgi:class 3 adenylate cyclase